jgi:hypothetical protein
MFNKIIAGVVSSFVLFGCDVKPNVAADADVGAVCTCPDVAAPAVDNAVAPAGASLGDKPVSSDQPASGLGVTVDPSAPVITNGVGVTTAPSTTSTSSGTVAAPTTAVGSGAAYPAGATTTVYPPGVGGSSTSVQVPSVTK